MDPVSAAAFAANVVTFLSSLGGPIASALKRRALKRSLERVVFRVTFSFAAANPATCETMAASAEEIALELAVLVGAGRPADSRALSDTWASLGHMSRPDAMRLADEYVKTLHDALLSVDSFGPLLQRGAAVSSAEILPWIHRPGGGVGSGGRERRLDGSGVRSGERRPWRAAGWAVRIQAPWRVEGVVAGPRTRRRCWRRRFGAGRFRSGRPRGRERRVGRRGTLGATASPGRGAWWCAALSG